MVGNILTRGKLPRDAADFNWFLNFVASMVVRMVIGIRKGNTIGIRKGNTVAQALACGS